MSPTNGPGRPTSGPDAPTTDDEALLALAERAARAAGRLLLAGAGHGRVDVAATKSSPTDVVTELDRTAERTIVETIRAARPDDAVLGEEGGASDGRTDVRWIVDPLDGTVNYTYGLTEWSISICAERAGESVAGLVLAPTRDELFAAVRGRGARLNGVPIHVPEGVPLDRALVATGFGYESAVRARQAALLPHVLPRVRDIRRMGSAALDLCAVACGRIDAYYESDLHPWDLAAGALVAREAGARVGSIGGPGRSETYVIAAAPDLYPALQALLRPLLPDERRGALGTMGR